MKIGAYEVQVTARANCRRMILRYRKDEGRLLLSVPPGTTLQEIRTFLDRNRAWIEKQMHTQTPWQPAYAMGERHWCLGCQLVLGRDAPCGEKFIDWRNSRLEQVLRRLLAKWIPRMGVRVTHVTLQEMTSRWGSCRAETGRLTFNTRLGLYEEALIEETVVHELCHFAHPNHSASFYAEMTRWLPDWRERKRRRETLDVRPMPPEQPL